MQATLGAAAPLSWYVPRAQAVHVAAPAAAANVPFGQFKHALAATAPVVGLCVPAAHWIHLSEPAVGWYWPEGHERQC